MVNENYKVNECMEPDIYNVKISSFFPTLLNEPYFLHYFIVDDNYFPEDPSLSFSIHNLCRIQLVPLINMIIYLERFLII